MQCRRPARRLHVVHHPVMHHMVVVHHSVVHHPVVHHPVVHHSVMHHVVVAHRFGGGAGDGSAGQYESCGGECNEFHKSVLSRAPRRVDTGTVWSAAFIY